MCCAELLTLRKLNLLCFAARLVQEGDDKWMQRLELESVAGAKGAAGMDRSMAAMKKVVVDERDLILAR